MCVFLGFIYGMKYLHHTIPIFQPQQPYAIINQPQLTSNISHLYLRLLLVKLRSFSWWLKHVESQWNLGQLKKHHSLGDKSPNPKTMILVRSKWGRGNLPIFISISISIYIYIYVHTALLEGITIPVILGYHPGTRVLTHSHLESLD